jgi:hypothetical protein
MVRTLSPAAKERCGCLRVSGSPIVNRSIELDELVEH